MHEHKSGAITRREFAKRAALTGAAATLTSRQALPQSPPPTPPPSNSPELPPASKSESDLRVQTILALYGSRFTESQTADLRKISASTQSALDHLRAYKLANATEPALYLKPLLEHEKRPTAPPAIPRSEPTSSKP